MAEVLRAAGGGGVALLAAVLPAWRVGAEELVTWLASGSAVLGLGIGLLSTRRLVRPLAPSLLGAAAAGLLAVAPLPEQATALGLAVGAPLLAALAGALSGAGLARSGSASIALGLAFGAPLAALGLVWLGPIATATGCAVLLLLPQAPGARVSAKVPSPRAIGTAGIAGAGAALVLAATWRTLPLLAPEAALAPLALVASAGVGAALRARLGPRPGGTGPLIALTFAVLVLGATAHEVLGSGAPAGLPGTAMGPLVAAAAACVGYAASRIVASGPAGLGALLLGAGTLWAGFPWIVEAAGFARSGLLGCALWVAAVLLAAMPAGTPRRLITTIAGALALVAILLGFAGARAPGSARGATAFWQAGRLHTIAISEQRGRLWLYRDDRAVGSAPARDASVLEEAGARWLGLLAALHAPDARRALGIDLGFGEALAWLPAEVTGVALESDPTQAQALREVAGRRARDPFAAGRFELQVGTGLTALRGTDGPFDLALLDQQHATRASRGWLARDALSELAEHLAPGGAVAIAAPLDGRSAADLAATLLGVWPHTEVYDVPGQATSVFVARREALPREERDAILERSRDFFANAGVSSASDVDVLLRADAAGARWLAERGDARRGPARHRRGGSIGALDALPPLTRPSQLAEVARALDHRWPARARARAEALADPAQREVGLALVAVHESAEPEKTARAAYEAAPQEPEIRAALFGATNRLPAPPPRSRGEAAGRAVSLILAAGASARTLEPAFVRTDPDDPFWRYTERFRCRWRLLTGGDPRLRECLDILAALHRRVGDPAALAMRANAAAGLGNPGEVLASLELRLRSPLVEDDASALRSSLAGIEVVEGSPEAIWMRDLATRITDRSLETLRQE